MQDSQHESTDWQLRVRACGLILGLLALQGGAASGENPPAPEEARVLRLSDVVVVATPVIEGNRTTRFGAQVTAVTQEQLEALNAQDLASALRRTPGVVVSRYNKVGSFGGGDGGAVFVRGAGSSRPGSEIQTLVDGLPVYNPVWNHPLLDLNAIGPAQAIEVYKGVQPSEFGNAFSSVNIIPKRRTTEGAETSVSTAYGNDSTFIETIESAGKKGALDYYAAQGYHTSKGHRPDANGELQDYCLRLGWKPAEHWDFTLFGMRTDNYAYDPGPRGRPADKEGKYETRSWLIAAGLTHTYEAADGEIKLYRNRGNGDWFDQAGAANDDTLNDWDLYGIRAREVVRPWEGGELLAGVDLDYMEGKARFTDDAGTVSHFPGARLRLFSPYAAVSHEFGDPEGLGLVPSAGVRCYEHSHFDSELAPHAGLVCRRGGTELRATYARGVSYPGLNVVVFSRNVLPTLGDSWRDLEAEKVHHYEVGVSQSLGSKVQADIACFYDDGTDRYVFYRRNPPGRPDTWENIERFIVKGAEATITANPTDNIAVFSSVTHLKTSPADLPYAPEWTFSGGLNIRFLEDYELNLDAQCVKTMEVSNQARLKDARNGDKIDPYFLLNGKLSRRFAFAKGKTTGKIFVAVENITDEDYEHQPSYPMPGINGMAGLEFTF